MMKKKQILSVRLMMPQVADDLDDWTWILFVSWIQLAFWKTIILRDEFHKVYRAAACLSPGSQHFSKFYWSFLCLLAAARLTRQPVMWFTF